MKKKSFGLAAAVAVLIVLGGSYALLANHNRIQESESAAAESETGVAVATIASDKVSSFQLADGDTSFTLTTAGSVFRTRRFRYPTMLLPNW